MISPNAHRLLPAGIVLIALLAIEALAWQVTRIDRGEILEKLASHGSEARATLEAELNSALYLTIGMSAYIQAQKGHLQKENLETWLQNLVKHGHHIRNIGVAPDNRIAFIYPLAGNEAAVGLYYPDLPDQWPAIEKMIKTATPTLTGPLQLKQGGRGFIYRVPVFIDQQYWGLISTVLDTESLLATLDHYNDSHEFRLALASSADHSASTFKTFWGTSSQPDDITYQMPLRMPNTLWQLTISAPDNHDNAWRVRLNGWLIIGVGLLFYRRQQQQKQRQQLAANMIRAQQAFNSAIFERVMDGVVTLDASGRVASANQAATRMLDLDATRDNDVYLHERLAIDNLSTETPDAWLNALTQSPARTGSLQTRSGILHVEALSARLVDVAQVQWLVVLRDISDRLRNEQMKNEFVSTVSHELRTPLTSVSGVLSLLANGVLGELPEKALKMAKIAESNARRLTLLINDLLDMEKLSQGKMRMQLQCVEVLPLLEQSIEENRNYADQYSVSLQLQAVTSVLRHQTLEIDIQRFLQVMANLLSNAIKYSPANDSVQISLTVIDNTLRISVCDNGPGIPEEFRHRIFEKFSQADSSDTRQKGGTGLGLAITRALVEQMNGRIHFETVCKSSADESSEVSPKTGTRFHVDFPLHRAG